MIRIIVAEDEYFARKVLIKMLRELNLDLEICGEAETGKEVLVLMQDNPVDIVITDIRMPDMDGLELAKEIYEKFPETSVIIESGYADFSYATTAIKYGVKYYLTKPIKPEELMDSICRVEEEKRKVTQRIEKKLAAKNAQYMDFMYLLEKHEIGEQILQEFFEKVIESSWHLAVAQCKERELTDDDVQKILQILEGQEKDFSIHAAYFYPKSEFVLLISGEDHGKNLISQILQKKVILCQNKTTHNLDIGVSHLRDKSSNPSKEIAAAYREGVYAVKQRLLRPERQVFRYEAEVAIHQLFSELDERQLEHYLSDGKIEESRQMIDTFLNRCKEENVSVYSFYTSLVQMINLINRVYNQKQRITESKSSFLFSFKTDLYSYRSIEEVRDYLFQLFQDVCGVEEQKTSIIADLLNYLEWNYPYDISVNDLAMYKYFVNPSYLSRLFKAETGQTLSRYLIELRMKKAAQMLKTSELKISDVAACVGYNDVSYFIQTFKKHYHVTPEQYKKES